MTYSVYDLCKVRLFIEFVLEKVADRLTLKARVVQPFGMRKGFVVKVEFSTNAMFVMAMAQVVLPISP